MIHDDGEPALIGMGSNVGDRWGHLTRALAELGEIEGIRVDSVSRIHETDPWGGPPGQGRFFNAACVITTRGWEPGALLDRLLVIERRAGRVRGAKNGPRTLDLDLLLMGNRRLATEALTLPHPGLPHRSFVLAPAVEVAAHWRHPVLNRTLEELWEAGPREGLVRIREDLDLIHDVRRSTHV